MASNSFKQTKQLVLDEAYVNVVSLLNETVKLFYITGACENCPPYYLYSLKSLHNKSFIMTTAYTQYITVKLNRTIICRFTENFSEYGNYLIKIFYDRTRQARCSKAIFLNFIDYDYNDKIISLDFITIFSFFSILYFSPIIIQFAYRYINKVKSHFLPSSNSKLKETEVSIEKQSSFTKPKFRLTSLDVFRGLNIILMLFINSGGAGYSAFRHTVWHGLNFAELPHGWFNWIMGVSVALSSSNARQTITVGQRMKRTIQRTTKMLFLGLVISSLSFTAELDKIPYFGVLQDLGILYFLAVFIDIILPRKQQTENNLNRFFLLDCNFLWPQWLILILAAIVHNSILFGFNVPKCGRGYLGPGGRHRIWKYKYCTGGAAGYIDRYLIPKHLASGLQFMDIYTTNLTLDPYGPVGLIGQIVQVYFGILAGEMFLLHKDKPKSVFKRWLFLSFLLGSLSFALCNTPLNYCFVPCSRLLWTSTFTCYICSSGFFLLSVLYFITDVQKWWTGWPVICPGTNSIFVYVGHRCLRDQFPFEWPTPRAHYCLLFKHLWKVFLWVLISAVMYHKKLFLTV